MRRKKESEDDRVHDLEPCGESGWPGCFMHRVPVRWAWTAS